MATATITAYVDAALALLAKSNTTYVAIGKTSAWENENIPPMPEEKVKDIQEIVGYKKMGTVSLCKQLKDDETTNYPTITYKGTKWALIPKEKAHEEGAFSLYLSVDIMGKDLPSGEYRQVGVYTDLVPKDSKKTSLLPEDVKTKGKLQFYDNRQRFNRTDNVTVTERFVISMKGE